MNQPIRRLSMLVALMFALLLGSSTWIQVLGSQDINDRPGNRRTQLESYSLSLIHISEPTRQCCTSRMPSSA